MAETERRSRGRAGSLKVAALSLGCAKNRIDTEEILGFLASRGATITDHSPEADVLLVNTCAFIDEARQESVNALLQAGIAGEGRDGPLVLAAGCLVQVYGSALLRAMPGVALALGVHSYGQLFRALQLARKGTRSCCRRAAPREYKTFHARLLTSGGGAAYVRIAEGCDNCCNYCLIPQIRGPYRSRDAAEIVAEVQDLLSRGVQEIVLIAQDTTAYGMDRPELPGLPGLLRMILEDKRFFRIRIMYAYPSRVSDELIALMAAEERICSYLDLPIQHSEDRVLACMGRHYKKKDLIVLLKKLRAVPGGVTLRTTCMVGHPGESRSDFLRLCRFTAIYPFEKMGLFVYSPQEGTTSAVLRGSVPARVARRRLKYLAFLQRRRALRLQRKLLGREINVLVEKVLESRSSLYLGRSEHQAPEVDGVVVIRSPKPLIPGSWVRCRVAATGPHDLLALALCPGNAERKEER